MANRDGQPINRRTILKAASAGTVGAIGLNSMGGSVSADHTNPPSYRNFGPRSTVIEGLDGDEVTIGLGASFEQPDGHTESLIQEIGCTYDLPNLGDNEHIYEIREPSLTLEPIDTHSYATIDLYDTYQNSGSGNGINFLSSLPWGAIHPAGNLINFALSFMSNPPDDGTTTHDEGHGCWVDFERVNKQDEDDPPVQTGLKTVIEPLNAQFSGTYRYEATLTGEAWSVIPFEIKLSEFSLTQEYYTCMGGDECEDVPHCETSGHCPQGQLCCDGECRDYSWCM